MTLDALIKRFEELKATDPDAGGKTVCVSCPIADEDCWLHADAVTVETESGGDASSNKFVRLRGGFGA